MIFSDFDIIIDSKYMVSKQFDEIYPPVFCIYSILTLNVCYKETSQFLCIKIPFIISRFLKSVRGERNYQEHT